MGDPIQNEHQGTLAGSSERDAKKYKLKILRKVVHSVSGILALIFYFFPAQENIFIFGLSVLIIISLLFDMIRLTFPHINDFVFEHMSFIFVSRDRKKINSAIFYFIGCLMTILLFPVQIAAIGILFLSFGDTAAAVGGMMLGKYIPFKIPRTQKTYIGLFCFFIVACGIGFLLGLPIKVAVIAALAGAIVEVLPLGIDDNFTIPLTASFVIWLFPVVF